MTFDALLIYAYSLVPAIALVGYVPQIVTLARLKKKLEDFPMSAWFLWFASSVISLIYALYHIQDFLFTLTCVLNVISISLVLLIAIYKSSYRPVLTHLHD